jgi:hypothetical protein
MAGGLAANQLVVGPAPVVNQAFGQFLYNTTTGQLPCDADGTGAGAAVNLVILQQNNFTTLATPLAAADFTVL